MKEENRVYLAAIRRRMQAKFNFITRQKRNQAFANLWYGWVHRCLRRSGGYTSAYLVKWKRGYIHREEAADFWQYIDE